MRLITLLLAMLPAPALALDCLYMSPGHVARSLMNEDVNPVVMRGELRYQSGQRFDEAMVDGTIDIEARAILKGRVVTADGYGPETQVEVTEHRACYDPWCVGPFTGETIEDAIFVMTKKAGGLHFDTGMCAFNGYGVTPEVEAELFTCLKGDPSCVPEW